MGCAFLSGRLDDGGMETEHLGERVKRLREARRMTQTQLADQLGVSTKTVSNWERGRNDPRSSIGALREFFGPSFDQGATDQGDGSDAVESAVRASPLDDWRQSAVVAEYRRHLHEQRREGLAG